MFTNAFMANDISEFLSVWLDNEMLSSENSTVFNRYYRSYKRCFGKYIRYYYRRQTKEIMDIIDKFKNPSILDVGCGCGTETLWFAYKLKDLGGSSVTAIDIDEKMLDTARERQQIIESEIKQDLPVVFSKKSILDLSCDVKYDVIWMEQAFHHLEPRDDVLRKLSDLTKPGGYLVFSESNAWSPINQLFLLWHRGFSTVYWKNGVMIGNERILTPKALKNNLQKNGFDNVDYQYFRMLPNEKWADYFLYPNAKLPLAFLYTHYSLIAKKV